MKSLQERYLNQQWLYSRKVVCPRLFPYYATALTQPAAKSAGWPVFDLKKTAPISAP